MLGVSYVRKPPEGFREFGFEGLSFVLNLCFFDPVVAKLPSGLSCVNPTGAPFFLQFSSSYPEPVGIAHKTVGKEGPRHTILNPKNLLPDTPVLGATRSTCPVMAGTAWSTCQSPSQKCKPLQGGLGFRV